MVLIIRRILSLCLLGYHRVLSPWLPPACRFYPTCAVYASQAVQKHGIVKGAFLSLCRLSRCHPWHLGGYDPVN